jgi:hypothetical protein
MIDKEKITGICVINLKEIRTRFSISSFSSPAFDFLSDIMPSLNYFVYSSKKLSGFMLSIYGYLHVRDRKAASNRRNVTIL